MYLIDMHGCLRTHPISGIFLRQTPREDVVRPLNHVSQPVIARSALDFHVARERQLCLTGGQVLSTQDHTNTCGVKAAEARVNKL